MQFWFCENCGKRLTDVDIEQGAARNKRLNGVYCSDCGVGVLTMEMPAVSTAVDQASKLTPKASTKSLPLPSPSRSRIRTAGQRNSNSPLAIMIVTGAVVVMAFTLTALSRLDNTNTPSAEADPQPFPVKNTPEVEPGVAPNPEKLRPALPASGAAPESPSTQEPPIERSSDPPPTVVVPLPTIVVPVPATTVIPPHDPVDVEKKPVTLVPPTASRETEEAAAREWAALSRTINSKNFAQLTAAITAFKERYPTARFLVERAEEIKNAAEYAIAGLNVDKGLASHWKFDEGSGVAISDSSGNKNHGKFMGTPRWGPGKLSAALAFDGKNDFVFIPSSPTLDRVQEADYSISAWVKVDNIPPGKGDDNYARYGVLLKSGYHTGLAYTDTGKFFLEHFLSNGECKGVVAKHVSPPGTYNHVTVTVSVKRGSGSIYVNGILENTDTWPPKATRNYGNESWRIGIGSPGAKVYAWPLKGVLDDVRLYTRVLSPAEIGILAGIPHKKK